MATAQLVAELERKSMTEYQAVLLYHEILKEQGLTEYWYRPGSAAG